MILYLLFFEEQITITDITQALNSQFNFEFDGSDGISSEITGDDDSFISISPAPDTHKYYEEGKIPMMNAAIYLVQCRRWERAHQLFETLWSQFEMIVDDDYGNSYKSYAELIS